MRFGQSFADGTDALEGFNAGLADGAKTDSKEKELQKECAERVAKRKQLDAEQESAKARQQSLTEELEKRDHEDKLFIGRVVSYLESKLGKFSEDMQRYGIPPRKKGGRKGPRKAS
ncbi:MAG: hypothetical protein Q7K21_08030 [Elusimicrobiota bacterium]|nr:hypothetical protein [Elusimicrobiota bacterium]